MGKKVDGSSPTTVAEWKVGTILNYEDYWGGVLPSFARMTEGFTTEWLMKFIQYEVLKYYPKDDWRDWETQSLRKSDFQMSFEAIDPLTAKESTVATQLAPLNLYAAFNQLDPLRTEIGIEFRFLGDVSALDYQKQAAVYFQIKDGWISPFEILIGDRAGRSTSSAPPYELKIKLPVWVDQNDAADSLMEGNLIMEVRKGFLYWSINQSQKAKIVDKRQST